MSGPPAKSKTQLRSESLERDQPSIGSCKAKGTRLRMGIFATFNFKSTICNLSSSPSAVGATQFSPGRKAWVTERRAAIPLALPQPRKHFLRCSLLFRPSALSRGPSSRPQRRDLSSILRFSSAAFPTPTPTQTHPTLPAEDGAKSGPPAKSKTQLRSECECDNIAQNARKKS